MLKKLLLTTFGFCCIFFSTPVYCDFAAETRLRKKIKDSWAILRDTNKNQKNWVKYEDALKKSFYPSWFRATNPAMKKAYKTQIAVIWKAMGRTSHLKKRDFTKFSNNIQAKYKKLGNTSGTLDYAGE